MKKVKVKCKFCKNAFYAKASHLKIGWGKYCSTKCHYQGMQVRQSVKCDVCEKEVELTLSQIQRSKSGKYFCSKSCQAVWRNKYFSGDKHALWKGGYSTYRQIMKKNNILPICSRCLKKR